MPCQDQLAQLRDRIQEIEATGAAVIGLAPTTPEQAAWLGRERGIPFPLLLDPDKGFREAVGFGRIRARDWLRPSGGAASVRAIARGGRQGRSPLANLDDRPGMVICDPEMRVAWRHEGRTIGDYPDVGTVLDELRRLTA